MPVLFPPVSVDDLARLHELRAAERGLADQVYELELEKIPLLAAGRRVREEHAQMYRRLATERGIPEHVFIDINQRTGEVAIREAPGAPKGEAAPPEKPESPSVEPPAASG